jgi:hypothetical protein
MNQKTLRSIRHIVYFIPIFLLLLVIVTHADNPSQGPYNAPCTDCLNTPLSPSLSSIPKFLSAALEAMVRIALPIITVFVVYSGFLFVTAQGNQSKLEDAKRNFFYVVLGALLILSAWILANLIGGTVTQVLGS